mgnify:CR=1 FL=1
MPGIGVASALEEARIQAEFVNPLPTSMLEVMSAVTSLERTRALGDVSGLTGLLAPALRLDVGDLATVAALEALRCTLGERLVEIGG